MKKTIALVIAVLMTLSLLAACGGNSAPAATEVPAAETPAATEAPALSGSVSTDGSTSMEKVIGALGEAYEQKTGVTVTYNPTGSGSGIKAVGEGRCDIGLSSRALKDEEKASGLTQTILAYDGIAVIVNPANPGRPDRQDRGAQTLHRLRHLRRHSASGRYVRLRRGRRHQ